MNFQEYIRYDAVGLAELIRKKEVSADEVLQAALNRLDEVNPKLNLLAHDLRERAAAWQGSSENADTPLAGVPFLLKDLLADWEGAPTWSGSRMMQHYIAKQNSDLTQAYLDAGLRVFGKTTTPEWGAYAVTETEIYGITRNPWHLDYTAGGSSGGAAAAVASGVVPAAHGSDGGGSIRLPAHNCGVFGLKPTRGRSSYAPNASEAWQGLVCDHVLTRSVRDSAVLLDIAAQTQARALYACPPSPENGFAGSLKQETGRLKIAFWKQAWFGGGNDEGTEAAFAHSLKLMQDAGHELEEATPDFAPPEQLNRAARIIVMGETAKLFYQYQYETGQKLPHRLLEPTTWAMIVQGRQISAGEMAWARDVTCCQSIFHTLRRVDDARLPAHHAKNRRNDAAARRTKSHAPAVRHAALGFSVEKQPVFRKRSRHDAAIRRLYVAAEHERQPRHERAALPASRAACRHSVRRRPRTRRHAA